MSNKEKVRLAIMRLTMCARRQCSICKYNNHQNSVHLFGECQDRITENMNILADEFFRNYEEEKYLSDYNGNYIDDSTSKNQMSPK